MGLGGISSTRGLKDKDNRGSEKAFLGVRYTLSNVGEKGKRRERPCPSQKKNED